MIVGKAGKEAVSLWKSREGKPSVRKGNSRSVLVDTPFVLVAWEGNSPMAGDQTDHVWVSEDKSAGLVWDGIVYNREEWERGSGLPFGARALWTKIAEHPASALTRLNGSFGLVFWDSARNRVLLARDHVGVASLFYELQHGGLTFGSDVPSLLGWSKTRPEVNRAALCKFLTFGYNPGLDTLLAGIRRVRQGHVLIWENGQTRAERFWTPGFGKAEDRSEAEWGEAVREELVRAVRIRIDPEVRAGAFLSGGLDSSSVVSCLFREGRKDLATFSFRCRGASFDESHYAQIVARTFGMSHRIVDYDPEHVVLARDMVEWMDEPFCDVGINIATILLLREAKGKVDDLFTGDGGDELFAGHPVYGADRVARIVRWIPPFVRNPIFSWGRSLSDTEKKKDWKVLVKRFSTSFAYPPALGTQRWRVYYTPDALKSLFVPDALDDRDADGIFDDALAYNREAQSLDPLSRTLYADYQTVVQFYLRRMGMARGFGLRPKLPMLDPGLVDLAARIPSGLKIQGTKVDKPIEKLAVEPLLPREIVHRKDKLGHSIPMKNWFRDHDGVRAFLFDLLSDEAIARRGLFRRDAVRRMLDEHNARRENHSHRLWALAVLELWMRHHFDQSG